MKKIATFTTPYQTYEEYKREMSKSFESEINDLKAKIIGSSLNVSDKKAELFKLKVEIEKELFNI